MSGQQKIDFWQVLCSFFLGKLSSEQKLHDTFLYFYILVVIVKQWHEYVFDELVCSSINNFNCYSANPIILLQTPSELFQWISRLKMKFFLFLSTSLSFCYLFSIYCMLNLKLYLVLPILSPFFLQYTKISTHRESWRFEVGYHVVYLIRNFNRNRKNVRKNRRGGLVLRDSDCITFLMQLVLQQLRNMTHASFSVSVYENVHDCNIWLLSN